MNRLEAIIPGSPQGYQRTGTRIVTPRHGGKPFVSHYEQKETRSWRAVAVACFTDNLGRPLVRHEDEPVRVTVEAVGTRPSSLAKREGMGRRHRTTKPDVDNVCKAVLDALVQAGVLRDDVLVAELVARSLVAGDGEAPHVRVLVEALEPMPVVPWPEKPRAVKAKPTPSAPGTLL